MINSDNNVEVGSFNITNNIRVNPQNYKEVVEKLKTSGDLSLVSLIPEESYFFRQVEGGKLESIIKKNIISKNIIPPFIYENLPIANKNGKGCDKYQAFLKPIKELINNPKALNTQINSYLLKFTEGAVQEEQRQNINIICENMKMFNIDNEFAKNIKLEKDFDEKYIAGYDEHNKKCYQDKVTSFLKYLVKAEENIYKTIFSIAKDCKFLNNNLDSNDFREELQQPAELNYIFKNHQYNGVVIGCGHDNIPRELTDAFYMEQEVSEGCKDDHKKDLCVTRGPEDCVLNADITDIDATKIEFWNNLSAVLGECKLEYVKDHTLESVLIQKDILNIIHNKILTAKGHLIIDCAPSLTKNDINEICKSGFYLADESNITLSEFDYSEAMCIMRYDFESCDIS